MEIEMVSVDSLNVPSWNATHILRPDLLVLADSLATDGVLSPLIVQTNGRFVIDGSQRLRLIQGNKHLAKQFLTVPVVWKDVSDTQALTMHLQINRGRGVLVAKRVSQIVRLLKRSRAYSVQDFNRKFAMKPDELELMLNPNIIKQRDVKNHSYSRAWVPVEAPAGTIDKPEISVQIERPPNPDR